MFSELRSNGFDVLTLHHAEAIITHDMPHSEKEIQDVLLDLSIPVEEIVAGGGGETLSTQRMRRALDALDWKKVTIEIKKTVDGREVESLTHEIDHIKKFGPADWTFALEIEWNNKDPFFDRDLENFKRLHTEGAISIGGIITRGESFQRSIRPLLLEFARQREIQTIDDLQKFGYSPTARQRKNIETRVRRNDGDLPQAWVDVFVADKYGEATTHWRKLDERVRRGVGNPCPLILIGIPGTVIKL